MISLGGLFTRSFLTGNEDVFAAPGASQTDLISTAIFPRVGPIRLTQRVFNLTLSTSYLFDISTSFKK